MMITMDIFHEPVNVKEMMSQIEPSIENEQIYQDLLQHLEQGEFILPTLPVAIVRGFRIHKPEI